MNTSEMTLRNSAGQAVKVDGVAVQRGLNRGLALVQIADGLTGPELAGFEAIVAGEVKAAKAGRYVVREQFDGISQAAQDHLDRLAKGVALIYGLSLSLARAVIIGALLMQDAKRGTVTCHTS